MTVWVGLAPEPDGDGVAVGTPEARDPDSEGGKAFEVGMTGCDEGGAPDPLAGGESGGRDGDPVGRPAEGVVGSGMGSPLVDPGPDGTTGGEILGNPLAEDPPGGFGTDDSALGGPLVGLNGGGEPEVGKGGTPVVDSPGGGLGADACGLDDPPVSPPCVVEAGGGITGGPLVGTICDGIPDGGLDSPPVDTPGKGLEAGGCTLGSPPVEPAGTDGAVGIPVDLGVRGTEDCTAGEDTGDDA